ncbi:hypothetical protein [Gluconobacter potus]|uniref:hypothetical protein n=1 Tax=Gluconobacter potus TaxID=2724927 RepID=UPI0012DA197B|nr:hypothetical protein [Gluconobacter potus]
MNKQFQLFLTILSFIVSFPFGFLMLKRIKMPCMNSGDLATWAGSVVAFLALVAAVVAAWLNKKSSDQALQNSAFMELSSLTSIKSSDANREFEKMLNDIREEKRKPSIGMAFDTTGKVKSVVYQSYQDKIRKCSEQIKKYPLIQLRRLMHQNWVRKRKTLSRKVL